MATYNIPWNETEFGMLIIMFIFLLLIIIVISIALSNLNSHNSYSPLIRIKKNKH